ncbi:phospholipase effector Tle1 domain-containing protein [Marinimicrobium locisalis]|uniref:phospholipase effector Tle1 domain-containing protein n=1 Tax=Marinimicrobium locisalis TaxID=546022 RepID=UPI003221E2B0
MTEVGEKVFVAKPTVIEKEKKEPVQELKVRLLLFFDGTLNNRTNVAQREGETDIYAEHEGMGSYENGRSNIALLESNVEKNIAGYDAVASVYVEGAGTENLEKDRTLGYALGTASTGVKRKTEKGIRDAVSNIQESLSNQSGKFVIKTVDVDCFGFSRGAATARYCIYQLTDDGGEPLQERLENRQLPTEAVTINFVGLFDTVSSHGVFYFNDVAALKLDAIHQAKKVVQLEAAEEYREKFSLTTIKSAKEKGKRICLPGAHSDVGGGYLDGPEDRTVFVGNKKNLISDYHWLKNHGWYQEDQLTVVPSKNPRFHKIEGKREHVSSSYSRIPLDIMREYMEEQSIQFKKNEMALSVKLPPKEAKLQELKERILGLIETPDISNPATWQKEDPLLNIARNRYFHMSSHYSIGMKPRWKNGRRVRNYYEG